MEKPALKSTWALYGAAVFKFYIW